MDFVSGLPNTKKGNNAILIIVDRLMKSARFIPMKTGNKMHVAPLSELFVNEIVIVMISLSPSLQTEIAYLFQGSGELYLNPWVPSYSSAQRITHKLTANQNGQYRPSKACYVLVS